MVNARWVKKFQLPTVKRTIKKMYRQDDIEVSITYGKANCRIPFGMYTIMFQLPTVKRTRYPTEVGYLEMFQLPTVKRTSGSVFKSALPVPFQLPTVKRTSQCDLL